MTSQDSNYDPRVFIVLKLTELSRSCSKRIITNVNYLSKAVDRVLDLSLFEKSIQESSVYKEPCVLKEK